MDRMRARLFPLVALIAGLASCGEGNVCVQACERMKDCARNNLAKLDCNDPQLKPACDAINKALAVDCSQASGVACQGDFKKESERTMSCDLDPTTCVCPRNICLEVCKDQKDCAEDSLRDLDCSDAENKAVCDALAPMAQKDCYAITDEACTGTLKAEAAALDACWPLDRTTCVCEQPP
jgi:hypothetical protein